MTKNITKNWVTIRRGEVFRSLGTAPDAWRYGGGCRNFKNRCDLCDTEIVYNFPLMLKSQHVTPNTSKKVGLWVGSECIKWYYQAWMPNGFERILEEITLARRVEHRRVIGEKMKEFAKKYPATHDFLFSPDSRAQFRMVYTFNKDGEPVNRSTSYYRASIRRKGYLRLDEIKALESNVMDWLKYCEQFEQKQKDLVKLGHQVRFLGL